MVEPGSKVCASSPYMPAFLCSFKRPAYQALTKLQSPVQTQLSSSPPCVCPPLFRCPPKPHERINKFQLTARLQAGRAEGPREASMSECSICSMEPATLPFSTLVPKGALSEKTELLWLIQVTGGKGWGLTKSLTGFHQHSKQAQKDRHGRGLWDPLF